MKVRALIPAAGRGTRLAGRHGGRPKELIRIGALTMIEHSLGMVLESGVLEVAVVIRPGKEAIRSVLEKFWAEKAPAAGVLQFYYQEYPRGVADAMRLAADFAADHALAVIMPDHVLLNGPPALAQMLEGFRFIRNNVIGVIPFPVSRSDQFGNVGRITLHQAPSGQPAPVHSLSPKGRGSLDPPGPGEYYKGMTGVIYLPGWPERIAGLSPNFQGELDDTDLVQELVAEGALYAVRLEGTGYDVGNPAGMGAILRNLGAENPS